jgi:hypothetical protein
MSCISCFHGKKSAGSGCTFYFRCIAENEVRFKVHYYKKVFIYFTFY